MVGVTGGGSGTKLVKDLYWLKLWVMRLGCMELLLKRRHVRIKKNEEKRKKVTSEAMDEVRSGGMSLEAGVTLAILGLSLVNSFRMERREEVNKKGEFNEMRKKKE